jgi:hypothetical protein
MQDHRNAAARYLAENVLCITVEQSAVAILQRVKDDRAGLVMKDPNFASCRQATMAWETKRAINRWLPPIERSASYRITRRAMTDTGTDCVSNGGTSWLGSDYTCNCTPDCPAAGAQYQHCADLAEGRTIYPGHSRRFRNVRARPL